MKTSRDEIIRTAFELFLEKGMTDVSIRDIMLKVGVTKAGFFSHFNNKDELMDAIINEQIIRYFDQEISIKEPTGQTFASQLELLFPQSANRVEEKRMFLLLMEGLKKYPNINKHYKYYVEKKIRKIHQLLEKWKENGDINPNLDLNDTSEIINMIMDGYITAYAIDSERIDDMVVKRMVSLITFLLK